MTYRLPAFCDRCGISYFSGIAITGNTRVTAFNNRVQCPNGHMGYIPDGIYDIIDGVARLSDFDRRQLTDIILAARRGRIAPEEAFKSAVDHLPKQEPLLKKNGTKKALNIVYAALRALGPLGAIAGIGSFSLDWTRPDAPSVTHNTTIINEVSHIAINESSFCEKMTRPIKGERERKRRLQQRQRAGQKRMKASKPLGSESPE
jgi:hypothetical protein